MPEHTSPAALDRGFLVAVEGIDWAGKSTVLKELVEFCQSKGLPHRRSREPTNGVWGRALRASAATGRLSLDEELELFCKDREEHVREVIRPALEAREVVLLDRYYLSTAAYQGARGADPDAIIARNEAFAPRPDLVLLLDLDPKVGLSRVSGRGDVPDAFEHEDQLQAVRKIFRGIQWPNIAIIDAGRPAEQVAEECAGQLAVALERRSLT